MKRAVNVSFDPDVESLPVRGRGLKPGDATVKSISLCRSPCGGAD